MAKLKNKLQSAVGIRLFHSTWGWRWLRNTRRTIAQASSHSRDGTVEAYVSEFQENGILALAAKEALDVNGIRLLADVTDLMQKRVSEDAVQNVLTHGHNDPTLTPFILHLLPDQLDIGSPFVQLAINPRLLSIINGYMGMKSFLRVVDGWLNFPTSEPAKSTQLWHKDKDDVMNVKAFIYLSGVDEASGPFCFVPGTHPMGGRKVRATSDEEGRITDSSMESAIDRSDWQICTGPQHTIVLADTCGYHKGLKPVSRNRLLMMFHYTSGRPRYGSSLHLKGDVTSDIGNDQKFALFR